MKKILSSKTINGIQYSVGDNIVIVNKNVTDILPILAIFGNDLKCEFIVPMNDGKFGPSNCFKGNQNKFSDKTIAWIEFTLSSLYNNEKIDECYIIPSYLASLSTSTSPTHKTNANICSCGKQCKPSDNGECYDCWNKKHCTSYNSI